MIHQSSDWNLGPGKISFLKHKAKLKMAALIIIGSSKKEKESKYYIVEFGFIPRMQEMFYIYNLINIICHISTRKNKNIII